jgi:hypothetical protein
VARPTILTLLGYKAYGFWRDPRTGAWTAEVHNFSGSSLHARRWVPRRRRQTHLGGGGSWFALPGGWQGALPAQGADTPLVRRNDWLRHRARAPRVALDGARNACIAWCPLLPPMTPPWAFARRPDVQPTALFRRCSAAWPRSARLPRACGGYLPLPPPLRASSALPTHRLGLRPLPGDPARYGHGVLTVTGSLSARILPSP